MAFPKLDLPFFINDGGV